MWEKRIWSTELQRNDSLVLFYFIIFYLHNYYYVPIIVCCKNVFKQLLSKYKDLFMKYKNIFYFKGMAEYMPVYLLYFINIKEL